MNSYRKMLVEKIANNGGYSRGYHDRFAIEYVVGLYLADTDIEDLAKVAAESHDMDLAFFYAIQDDLDWDGERAWERAQEDMAEGLGDDCAHSTYSPDTAKMFGLPYLRFPLKYKRRTNECAYYPAQKTNWILDNPYTNLHFDVKFGLAGRGGKHLVIREFEGHDLGVSSEDLCEQIEHDDCGDFPNAWCQKLLAMMTEWEQMFTSRNASKELEYQLAYRLAQSVQDKYDEYEAAAKEEVERKYWNERDVVTQH